MQPLGQFAFVLLPEWVVRVPCPRIAHRRQIQQPPQFGMTLMADAPPPLPGAAVADLGIESDIGHKLVGMAEVMGFQLGSYGSGRDFPDAGNCLESLHQVMQLAPGACLPDPPVQLISPGLQIATGALQRLSGIGQRPLLRPQTGQTLYDSLSGGQ